MRVVLVDPSRTVQKFVTRLLEARDHEVHAFADGDAALDCVRSNQAIDALITSAVLPNTSGLELCWETRLLVSDKRPIYIMVMSSNDDPEIHIESLDSGADDFIRKPIVAGELYARLRAAERLGSMQRELIRLATTDALTGMLNRRAFFARANDAAANAASGSKLSAIMMDIDHFKRINDTHGHDVGDIVLRSVSKTLADQAEVVGRLGGEEFAIMLEGCSLDQGVELATQLRVNVAELAFDGGDAPFHVTCSFGVSTWQDDDTFDRLLKRADVALYAAKTGGRNRVIANNPDTFPPLESEGVGSVRSRTRDGAR